MTALVLLLNGSQLSHAQTAFLDFSGGLGGWTTDGTLTVLSTTDSFTIGSSPYSLTPAAGNSMVKIMPAGGAIYGASAADSAMGLSAGTIAALLNNSAGSVTNFGLLSDSFNFAAGTYKFAWAYAASDYQPFNDGVLFAVSGNSTQIVTSLARNGSDPTDLSGPSAGTKILGSYGSTAWITSTFTIATAGSYQVSFASYNWADTGLDPVYYVTGTAGTFTGTPVGTSGDPEPPPPPSATDIDTAAASYDASNLGTTLNAVFTGGTLAANVPTIAANFTVNSGGGTIQSAGGTTSTFSGVIADSGGPGAITITSDGAGGSIVFSGASTYTGATSIASGATLQLAGGGSLASPVINIAAGGTLADTNGGLAPASLVTNAGQLTFGASQTIAGLTSTSTGTVSLGGGTLTVGGGTIAGGVSGAGGLQKVGAGTLVLGGTNTFTGPTTVTQGQLILGGSLAGNVTVGVAGLLSGTGSIHGSLSDAGIVSPGNSPGILAVDGDYTEAGTLRIEIDGAAGAGVNPDGHDQLAVGGSATFESGSVLQLTRTNTFEPVWGQRFRVVAAAGGLGGTISTLDRSAFATQLLFDYGTGQVYGTGLAQGAAVGSLAGDSANRRAILDVVARGALAADSTGQLSFLDSRRSPGSLFLALFNNPDPAPVLDVLSPVAYAGLTDYALQVTRNFSRDARYVPALAAASGWTLSAGYTGYRNGLSAVAADDTNTDLRSNAATVDVTHKLGERFTLGGSFTADDGAIRARRFSADATGQVVGLHLGWQPWTSRSLVLEGGASYGSYDFDTARATLSGRATAKTDADAYDLWGRAKAGLYHTDRIGLSALAGLAYTRATVSGFGESNGVDALTIGKLKDELVVGEIGAELSLQLGEGLRVVGEAAFEHNFQAPRREVFARFTDSSALFRVTAHGFDRDAVRGGIRAEYALSERFTVSAHYSAAISSSSEAAQTFGAKLQYRF